MSRRRARDREGVGRVLARLAPASRRSTGTRAPSFWPGSNLGNCVSRRCRCVPRLRLPCAAANTADAAVAPGRKVAGRGLRALRDTAAAQAIGRDELLSFARFARFAARACAANLQLRPGPNPG